MQKYNYLFCLLFLFVAFSDLCGQQRRSSTRRNIGHGILASINIGAQWPGADLADSYGENMTIGGALEWQTDKQNLIFGAEFDYNFGNKVDEDVIFGLRQPNGEIIGQDGVYSSVVLRMRGFYAGLKVGKVFPILKNNPRSGIKVTIGAGLLQHKIRIQDDSRQVPQVAGDYAKGYDRLTNGFALKQFIGYHLLSNNKLTNFYAGFEFIQGFTQNRRDWDFVVRDKIDNQRLDLLFGIRVGWILPFYVGGNTSEIYY